MHLRRGPRLLAALALAVATAFAALPADALAARALVKSLGNSGTGTTLACVNITIPGVTQPVTFTIGDLVFSYDPTGTCSGSGGATGGGTA